MKTVEEAAKRYANTKSSSDVFIESHIKDFKAGVEFAQRWIPVEEDLPELGEKGYSKNVLICDDPQDEDDARICFYARQSEYESHWNANEHPAYWRPINLE